MVIVPVLNIRTTKPNAVRPNTDRPGGGIPNGNLPEGDADAEYFKGALLI